MSKASTICKSCGEENEGNSEFCINCGTTLQNSNTSDQKSKKKSKIDRKQREYEDWKRSVPYTLSACIFLLFIDYITSGSLSWSYWPVVPIVLFAIIAPYFSHKI